MCTPAQQHAHLLSLMCSCPALTDHSSSQGAVLQQPDDQPQQSGDGNGSGDAAETSSSSETRSKAAQPQVVGSDSMQRAERLLQSWHAPTCKLLLSCSAPVVRKIHTNEHLRNQGTACSLYIAAMALARWPFYKSAPLPEEVSSARCTSESESSAVLRRHSLTLFCFI
jgi:hypothetical protein